MKTKGLNSCSSWGIVAMISIINFVSMIPYNLGGLFFVEIVSYYQASRGLAAFPTFISLLVRCSGGPLVGIAAKKVGIGTVIILGGFLCFLGMGVCFIASSIGVVIIFLGAVYGIGFALCNTLLPQIIKENFDKNIAAANGASEIGNCIGALMIPFLAEFLLNLYGVQGTLLIMSALALNCLPATMFMKIGNKNTKDVIPTSNQNYDTEYTAIGWDDKSTESDTKDVIPTSNRNDDTEYAAVGFSDKSAESDIEDVIPTSNQNDNIKYTAVGLNDKSTESQILKEISKNENFVTNYNKDCYVKQNASIEPDLKLTVNSTNAENERTLQISSDNPLKDCNQDVAVETTKAVGETNLFSQDEGLLPISKNTEELQSEITSFINPNDSTKDKQSKNQHCKRISSELIDNEFVKIGKPAHSSTIRETLQIFLDSTFDFILIIQSNHIYVSAMFLTIVIDFSRERGIDRFYEPYILMCSPLAGLIGRPLIGILSDSHFITLTQLSLVSFIIPATLIVFLTYVNTFPIFVCTLLIKHMFTAGLYTLFPMQVFKYMDEDKHIVALSTRFVLFGPMIFTVPYLIGHFKDTMGSYNGVLYLLSGLCVLNGLMCLLLPSLAAKRRSKKRKHFVQEIL